MNKFVRQIASAALALVVLLSAVPAMPAHADDTAATEAVTDKTIAASYTEETISVNGKLTESGWSLNTLLTDEVQIGVPWNLTTLYIASRTPNQEEITITLNGTEITKNNAKIKSATNKKLTEHSIDFSEINIAVNDYGVKIPAKFQVGDTVWNGTIVLSSTEWFVADNPNAVSKTSGLSIRGLRLVDPNSKSTGKQGAAAITGGYNYYDKYDPNGLNPPAVCTQRTYSGKTYTSLSDRTANTVIGFTFCANSMPVSPLGTDNDFYPYIMAGFTCYATATSIGGSPSYVDMGIVNTDLGDLDERRQHHPFR